mmetsp:Transcript_90226/g.254571  ORF Transcript_90226/g.254571 Transcript_90226/m.254571 type:complete len:229 (+) Transcript_90226:463-1149(+)
MADGQGKSVGRDSAHVGAVQLGCRRGGAYSELNLLGLRSNHSSRRHPREAVRRQASAPWGRHPLLDSDDCRASCSIDVDRSVYFHTRAGRNWGGLGARCWLDHDRDMDPRDRAQSCGGHHRQRQEFRINRRPASGAFDHQRLRLASFVLCLRIARPALGGALGRVWQRSGGLVQHFSQQPTGGDADPVGQDPRHASTLGSNRCALRPRLGSLRLAHLDAKVLKPGPWL